jgi:hypothetical protein
VAFRRSAETTLEPLTYSIRVCRPSLAACPAPRQTRGAEPSSGTNYGFADAAIIGLADTIAFLTAKSITWSRTEDPACESVSIRRDHQCACEEALNTVRRHLVDPSVLKRRQDVPAKHAVEGPDGRRSCSGTQLDRPGFCDVTEGRSSIHPFEGARYLS